uniref:Uncharacterized protein n=1 Tax=Fagus sylvatica TaxID=28930 RepID=A0A2N9HD93_FAGSY
MLPCVCRFACHTAVVRLCAACLARGGGWLLLAAARLAAPPSVICAGGRDLVADRGGGPVVSR